MTATTIIRAFPIPTIFNNVFSSIPPKVNVFR